MKNVKSGHSQPIVVLDPGHYGSTYNPGAVKGYYESEQMWKLCRLQKAAMEAYGIKVIVTRSVQAKDLALVERGKLAAGADIFESLHSNGCDTERVDRPECIYLVDDDCGAIDTQSKEFANLMAQTVRDCMDTDDPAKVFSRKSSYDRDGDGLKNDDYYGVLYGAHQVGTAACITEHSFHTNKRMATWLMDDANLQKLAEAKAKAYAQWFGVEKVTTGTTSSAAKTVKAKEAAKSGPLTSLAGTYKVTASALNVRHGAGTTKSVMVTIPKGTKVNCYGYYTTASGTKWLYIQFTYGGVTYTGFASGKYLEKV